MDDSQLRQDPPKEKIAIIGLGKAGTAMGHLLRRAGYPIVAVVARTTASLAARHRYTGGQIFGPEASAQAATLADCILITTPDDVIGRVCRTIAAGGGFHRGDKVIHLSGAGGLDLLAPARAAGAHVACLHPLQSFADVEGAIRNLPSSTFGITADQELQVWATTLVRTLGGIPLPVPADSKPLYHAAACMASNYLTTLLHMVTDIYCRLGLSRAEAFRAFWPLVLGTLRNIETKGTVAALTGPISRGDAGTIEQHLAGFGEQLPEHLEVYRALGRQTVALAQEKKTLSPDQARLILTLLKEVQR